MEALGRPLVLLAALWGAVNTTLNFFEIINQRRDIMFGLIDRCGACADAGITLGPLELYFTNLLPLTVGLMIFLALIGYVVISIPDFMRLDDAEKIKMRSVARMVSILPFFGFFGFLCGGIFDLMIISPYFNL
jgi:hypothetical protein